MSYISAYSNPISRLLDMRGKGTKGGWKIGVYEYGENGSDENTAGDIFLLSDGRICCGGDDLSAYSFASAASVHTRGSAYSLLDWFNTRIMPLVKELERGKHLPWNVVRSVPREEEEIRSVLSGLRKLRSELEAR